MCGRVNVDRRSSSSSTSSALSSSSPQRLPARVASPRSPAALAAGGEACAASRARLDLVTMSLHAAAPPPPPTSDLLQCGPPATGRLAGWMYPGMHDTTTHARHMHQRTYLIPRQPCRCQCQSINSNMTIIGQRILAIIDDFFLQRIYKVPPMFTFVNCEFL